MQFGSPENTPLSEEYKRGFNAALRAARECVDFEIKAYGLSKNKPNDTGTTQWHILLGVDTAIQQRYPR